TVLMMLTNVGINPVKIPDLEPKRGRASRSRAQRTTTKRLKYLRFNIINILNSLQHYLFGFVFNKDRIQFELDFEKSNDLKSLTAAHEGFIGAVHRATAQIRDEKRDHHGFGTVKALAEIMKLLKCVKMLKVMWNEREHATVENLDNCYRTYRMSFDVINSIVNPVYVFDY
ncbi:Spc97 Spc98 domain containing protein, partial [Asbolus verrucosus]